MTRWEGAKPIQWLIALIGIHSCALGMLLLFFPRFMLRSFGFPLSTPIFYPSQSGIFLLILGVCYLLAVVEPALVRVILISKAFAVAFLFYHAAFLSAPPVIWAAGAGDAAMLAVLSVALRRHHSLMLESPSR